MSFYVVSTPIGNLKDITFRAVEVLKKVHFILAEDTRISARLLREYDIETPMVSYRDQNHSKVLPKVREKLDMGLDLALISDAGTPTLSDPGYKLISALREDINKGKDWEIISVPGAFAGAAALSVSGLPTDRFVFLGFLPKSSGKRKDILQRYLGLELSLVLYESPKRLVSLLELVKELGGEGRKVSVVSELTKMYEDIKFGRVDNILSAFRDEKVKGEYILIIGKSGL